MIPFLEAAYSRACEYTCDNIGDALAPGKSVAALVLLAAGRDVYKRVNPESYVRNAEENNTAVVKFAGLFMSHPYLPRRIVITSYSIHYTKLYDSFHLGLRGLPEDHPDGPP